MTRELKEQTQRVYKDMAISNLNPMIVAYFDCKMLSKMGIKRDVNELTDFEVSCYRIISNALAKEENKELKKKK